MLDPHISAISVICTSTARYR